jgi:hypothetical protein
MTHVYVETCAVCKGTKTTKPPSQIRDEMPTTATYTKGTSRMCTRLECIEPNSNRYHQNTVWLFYTFR